MLLVVGVVILLLLLLWRVAYLLGEAVVAEWNLFPNPLRNEELECALVLAEGRQRL